MPADQHADVVDAVFVEANRFGQLAPAGLIVGGRFQHRSPASQERPGDAEPGGNDRHLAVVSGGQLGTGRHGPLPVPARSADGLRERQDSDRIVEPFVGQEQVLSRPDVRLDEELGEARRIQRDRPRGGLPGAVVADGVAGAQQLRRFHGRPGLAVRDLAFQDVDLGRAAALDLDGELGAEIDDVARGGAHGEAGRLLGRADGEPSVDQLGAAAGFHPEFGRSFQDHRGAAVEAQDDQPALQLQRPGRQPLALGRVILLPPLAVVRKEECRHGVCVRPIVVRPRGDPVVPRARPDRAREHRQAGAEEQGGGQASDAQDARVARRRRPRRLGAPREGRQFLRQRLPSAELVPQLGIQRKVLQVQLAGFGVAVEQFVEPRALLRRQRAVAQPAEQVPQLLLPVGGAAHTAPPAVSERSMQVSSVSRIR